MARLIDVSGARYTRGIQGPVPFDPLHTTAATSGSSAQLSLAADTQRPLVLSQIHCGYHATPTGGALTVEDGAGNTVFQALIPAAGNLEFNFDPPLSGTKNTALIVTLGAGGAGVRPYLNLNARIE